MLLVNLFRLQVTYGSVLKLQHERTKFRLHSHEVPYGSGSGQQSVTGFPGVEDANSYWVSVLTYMVVLSLRGQRDLECNVWAKKMSLYCVMHRASVSGEIKSKRFKPHLDRKENKAFRPSRMTSLETRMWNEAMCWY